MSPNAAGLLGLLGCIAIGVMGFIAVTKLDGREHWYEQGFSDCKRYYKDFMLTEDDEIVLKHLKNAFTAYIKAKRYQRKGDIKKIAQTADFDELRQVVWDICERENR